MSIKFPVARILFQYIFSATKLQKVAPPKPGRGRNFSIYRPRATALHPGIAPNKIITVQVRRFIKIWITVFRIRIQGSSGSGSGFEGLKKIKNIYDGKSIFIEVLHIYVYDPVTIFRVSTQLHCCNIIKRVIPPFAITLSLWNYFYPFITGKTPIFLFF